MTPELSICIASYGEDCSPLLQALGNEIALRNIAAEILVSDNAPEIHGKAAWWNEFPHTQYFHERQHLGRSQNRNALSRRANGQYLLFMDADSIPCNANFLEVYMAVMKSGAQVAVGGTAYKPWNSSPAPLRVRIGAIKEAVPAATRNKHPYAGFSAFNFCITAECFTNIGGFEELDHYGHEDTLFGIALEENQAKIIHLDNPAYHLGIDSNEEYLAKVNTATEALGKLFLENRTNNGITLIRFYKALNRTGLVGAYTNLFQRYRPGMEKRLLAGKGSPRLLDFYKLGVLTSYLRPA